jgi:hypothetical protein
MRLIGYIKEINANSFAIPIYGDGTKDYYTHRIDALFNVLNFEKIIIDERMFKRLYLIKKFDIGETGAIVFVTNEGYPIFNNAINVLEDITFYLKEATLDSEYINIKNEVKSLESIVNKRKYKIQDKFKASDIREIEVFEEVILEVNQTENEESYDFNLYKLKDIDRFNISEKYPLENYLKDKKFFLIFNRPSEKLYESYIETINDNLNLGHGVHNEVLGYLFYQFISKQTGFYKNNYSDIIVNEFIEYLKDMHINYSKPLEMSIEELLMQRSEERRRKMKEFNYQFHSKSFSSKTFEEGIDVIKSEAKPSNL